MESSNKYVQVHIAPEILTDTTGRQSVHVVVDKRPASIPDLPKLQSFAFSPSTITINSTSISTIYLYNLLWQINNGISKTAPHLINHFIIEDKFYGSSIVLDPSAGGIKGMPTSWSFIWDGIPCSIVTTTHYLYIRVHNLDSTSGQKVIHGIMSKLWADHVDRSNQHRGTVKIYVAHEPPHQGWHQTAEKPVRGMETIYLDIELKQRLVTQLQKFFTSQSMYDKYGVPYKRVYLFEGPPGTGKSSLAFTLASIFKHHLAKLTVTPRMTSADVEERFSSVPHKTFLLLEDVDSLLTEGTKLSLSTLLNCLDGVATKSGLVVFMTTNHAVVLEKALVRPGRVDMRVKFTYPSRAELLAALQSLGSQYASEHEALLEAIKGVKLSIAALQQFLFDSIQLERPTLMPHIDELFNLVDHQK